MSGSFWWVCMLSCLLYQLHGRFALTGVYAWCDVPPQ